MALSPDCIEQHQKEWAITRRSLGWGLVWAAGFYGGMVGLMRSQGPAQTRQTEPIELVIVAAEADGAVALEGRPLASQTIATKTEIPDRPDTVNELEPSAEPKTAGDRTAATEAKPAENLENPEKSDAPEDPETSTVPGTSTERKPGGGEAKPAAEGPVLPASSESSTRFGAGSVTPGAGIIPLRIDQGTIRKTFPAVGDGPGAASSDDTPVNSSGTADRRPPTSPEHTAAPGTRTFGCRSCFQPAYPEAAKAAGAEGTSRVNYTVDAAGNVITVSLARSSGHAALDTAALAAVWRYKFTPGGQGRTRTLEINFSLAGTARNRAAQQQGERRQVEEPVEPTEIADTPARQAEPASGELLQVTEDSGENTPESTTSAPEAVPLTEEAEPAPPVAAPTPPVESPQTPVPEAAPAPSVPVQTPAEAVSPPPVPVQETAPATDPEPAMDL